MYGVLPDQHEAPLLQRSLITPVYPRPAGDLKGNTIDSLTPAECSGATQDVSALQNVLKYPRALDLLLTTARSSGTDMTPAACHSLVLTHDYHLHY